jgi:hypothetical protein
MSDETMRKAGRAELDRLNAGAKKAAPETPKKKPRHKAATFGDLVGIGKAKERRVGEKGQTVSDVVDEAVKGAKSEY